jgi:hypothetical protein
MATVAFAPLPASYSEKRAVPGPAWGQARPSWLAPSLSVHFHCAGRRAATATAAARLGEAAPEGLRSGPMSNPGPQTPKPPDPGARAPLSTGHSRVRMLVGTHRRGAGLGLHHAPC